MDNTSYVICAVNPRRGFDRNWNYVERYLIGECPPKVVDGTNRKIFRWLRNCGYLPVESKGNVRIEREPDALVLRAANNGQPLLTIEREVQHEAIQS